MASEPLNPFLYFLVSLVKRCALLPRSLRLSCVRLRGIASGGGGALTVMYIGEGESLGYVKKAYFDTVSVESLGAIPISALKKTAKYNHDGSAVVIIEVNRFLYFCVPARGYKTFSWIKQKVSVTGKEFKARRPRIEEVYGRKVRQQEYVYERTSDPREVRRFYREMYLPYVSDRYKENTHPRSLQEFQRAARAGFLIKVFENNSWVAGLVCARHALTIQNYAGGVARDFQYHLKRGAHSACEYFMFQWAQENGIKTVDMLRTRPNLLDGVYQYKRKWAARPHKDSWPHTALWISVPSATCVPEIIKKQLIWRDGSFIALEEALDKDITGQ